MTASQIKKATLLLISAGLLLGLSARADSPRYATLMRVAKELQPALSNSSADEIAKAFVHTYKNGCSVEWPLLMSIAYNESSLLKRSVNSKSKDYGLMQLNERTISRLGLDKARLMHNVAYALQKGCEIVMHNRKAYSDKYWYWLGVYRAGTALHKESVRNNAMAYDLIVRRLAVRIERIGAKTVARKK